MGLFIDKEKLLIKNTTREQRQHSVDQAITIGSLDSLPATKSAMILLQKYIDGEMEIDEIQNEIIVNHNKYLE